MVILFIKFNLFQSCTCKIDLHTSAVKLGACTLAYTTSNTFNMHYKQSTSIHVMLSLWIVLFTFNPPQPQRACSTAAVHSMIGRKLLPWLFMSCDVWFGPAIRSTSFLHSWLPRPTPDPPLRTATFNNWLSLSTRIK